MKRGYLASFRHWGAWKSLGYRIAHRTSNRWMDLQARLAGACNASTWNEAKGDYDGGYSHWRCGKPRGHDRQVKVFRDGDYVDGATYGPHRFNNYIWPGPGTRVQYAPVPVRGLTEYGQDMDKLVPFRRQTNRRHGIDTLRRSRRRAERYEASAAAGRADRQGA